MNEAQKLTTLPKNDQDVVIEVMEDHQMDKSAIRHLVDQAATLRKKKGEVTKESLSQSVHDLNRDLKRYRDLFKLKRGEYGLGPQHLFELAQDEVFVAVVEDAGIDISYFEQG